MDVAKIVNGANPHRSTRDQFDAVETVGIHCIYQFALMLVLGEVKFRHRLVLV